MSGLLVLALFVVGLALTAFGIVAIRDEPPRWMLRVRRPGRVLALGITVLIAAFIANQFRYSMEEVLTETRVGKRVECEKLGSLEVEGEERDAYACTVQGGDERVGCFVRDGDGVLDVTGRAEAPGAFPGKNVDC